jgi:hypothetical protein
MIKKIYFPRLTLPISSMLAGFVDFFLAFIVLLGMMLLLWVCSNDQYSMVPGIYTPRDDDSPGCQFMALGAECSIQGRALYDPIYYTGMAFCDPGCLSEQSVV